MNRFKLFTLISLLSLGSTSIVFSMEKDNPGEEWDKRWKVIDQHAEERENNDQRESDDNK